MPVRIWPGVLDDIWGVVFLLLTGVCSGIMPGRIWGASGPLAFIREKTMSESVCLFCSKPILTKTYYGEGGTRWIHTDGYAECRPTYAAPNFSVHKPRIGRS